VNNFIKYVVIVICACTLCILSSFLRATAGLWTTGFGKITWYTPRNDTAITTLNQTVFFLPQKPYNLIGSLKSQICYPATFTTPFVNYTSLNSITTLINEESIETRSDSKENCSDDEYFLSLLKIVKLDSLAYRVGEGDEGMGLRVIKDWSKILSLGEQQRLAFARVVYNQPKIIFLDGNSVYYYFINIVVVLITFELILFIKI
jgi:ABC-type uncharacterized transport system fused permease/ATPase subunit